MTIRIKSEPVHLSRNVTDDRFYWCHSLYPTLVANTKYQLLHHDRVLLTDFLNTPSIDHFTKPTHWIKRFWNVEVQIDTCEPIPRRFDHAFAYWDHMLSRPLQYNADLTLFFLIMDKDHNGHYVVHSLWMPNKTDDFNFFAMKLRTLRDVTLKQLL